MVNSSLNIDLLIPEIAGIIPYKYESIRCSLYDNILNNIIGKKIPNSNKFIFHMLGIPGSGKTTFIKTVEEINSDNCVLIAFDDIMERIPYYREDNIKLGSVESFKKWEIPARVIGYELLVRSIESSLSIFFDHGGLCRQHVSLMSNIRSYGYKTIMKFMNCDLKTAQERVVKRETVTGRHTPVEMINKRHGLLKELMPIYKNMVDEFIN